MTTGEKIVKMLGVEPFAVGIIKGERRSIIFGCVHGPSIRFTDERISEIAAYYKEKNGTDIPELELEEDLEEWSEL